VTTKKCLFFTFLAQFVFCCSRSGSVRRAKVLRMIATTEANRVYYSKCCIDYCNRPDQGLQGYSNMILSPLRVSIQLKIQSCLRFGRITVNERFIPLKAPVLFKVQFHKV
jgi:hypothetical protein